MSPRPCALLLLLLSALPAPAAGSAATASGRWSVQKVSVDLSLAPQKRRIAVRCEIDIEPAGEPSSTIEFLLNGALTIASLKVNGADVRWTVEADAEGDQIAPAARRVTLPAPGVDPAEDPQAVRLEIEYEGEMAGGPDSLFRVSPGLTELNIYGAWVPLFDGPQGFPYDLRIAAPAGHRVVSTGLAAPARAAARTDAEEPSPKEGSGGAAVRLWKHRLLGDSSAGDLPVITSAGLHPIAVPPSRSCSIELIATDLPPGSGEKIAEEAAWACEFLAGRTGRGRSPERSLEEREPVRLRIVIVPREDSGYARPPLVVLPAGWFTGDGIDLLSPDAGEWEWRRRLYHEMAHAFAPIAETRSYHDWLNEGLAEHLALEALAARLGPAVSALYIRDYLLDLAARPPAPPVRPAPAADGPGWAGPPPDPSAEPALRRRPPESADIAAVSPEPPGAGAPSGARIALAAISETLRSDPDATLLYYRKGALIFRLLAASLGADDLAETLASLQRVFAPASRRRMTTEDLIAALERRSGESHAWLRRDWVDGAGLAHLDGFFRVSRSSSAGEDLPFLVEGEILQAPGERFRSPVPLEARGRSAAITRLVRLSGPRTPVEWRLPFKPREIRIDPDRVVPRIDATVEESVRRREEIERAIALEREGLSAERAGNYRTALDRYKEAGALDPGSSFPFYRRGRVLAALDRPKEAIASHRRSLRIGKRLERERRRVEKRCGEESPMACEEPIVWLRPPLDLRAWDWVRIGQMQERRGRSLSARRAFERALAMPDFAGAHDEARRALERATVE